MPANNLRFRVITDEYTELLNCVQNTYIDWSMCEPESYDRNRAWESYYKARDRFEKYEAEMQNPKH
jgi:hypothetical protein